MVWSNRDSSVSNTENRQVGIDGSPFVSAKHPATVLEVLKEHAAMYGLSREKMPSLMNERLAPFTFQEP